MKKSSNINFLTKKLAAANKDITLKKIVKPLPIETPPYCLLNLPNHSPVTLPDWCPKTWETRQTKENVTDLGGVETLASFPTSFFPFGFIYNCNCCKGRSLREGQPDKLISLLDWTLRQQADLSN